MIKGFTLLELIVVIVIIGVLATLGLNQYNYAVEKGRSAEAKVNMAFTRKRIIEYWMKNGDLSSIANSDVGLDLTCRSTQYFRYDIIAQTATTTMLRAFRCNKVTVGGGKSPDAPREHELYMSYTPSTGEGSLICIWTDDFSPCSF